MSVGGDADDPVVCVCAGLSENDLVRLIRSGAGTVEILRSAGGANTGCGGCREELEELLDDFAPIRGGRSHAD
jgi:NAD(P)H-nitrite reductase large subunit